MANTIPEHQAIKFYNESDEYFNNTQECPCDDLNEKWTYLVKPGDVTAVQVKVDCVPVELDSNIILNGSFETQGVSPAQAANWTISDTERVQRANDDPYQGAWALRWNNPEAGSSTVTQDTDVDFLAGETWLLQFYAKVTNPATPYPTPLEVIVGGVTFDVTPTEDYTLISIPIVFIANGSDQNVVFSHPGTTEVADFMYVDLVTLQKVNYTQNNCAFDLVYNGSFEYGQNKVTGDSPQSANFDGWVLTNTVEETLTGGLDGTRCPILEGAIAQAAITQDHACMIENSVYQISFWAKIGVVTTAENFLIVETNDASLSNTYTLTTEWTEYVIDFYVAGADGVLNFYTELDDVYIDNVQITLVNPVNEDSIYVHDIENDKYYTEEMGTTPFEGGYNAEFFWEEMIGSDTPGCLQIITEFAESNLISNSKFEIGTGNLFTDWSLNPGNGSITQTTTGGLSGSRGIVLTRVTNNVLIVQTVLQPNTNYKISLWVKRLAGTGQIRINSDMTIFGLIDPTTTFKRYEFSVTTGNVDNDFAIVNISDGLSVVIDNVFISEEGAGIHYSDLFTYDKTNGICAPEMVWYDSQDEVFGINYESGFQNKIRIKDLNSQLLSYPTEDFNKTLNGLESSISRAIVKKQKTFNIPRLSGPELIHDRLAIAVRHTNIEIDTAPYCSVEETTYTPVDSDAGCRLIAAQVILGIEGEILGERSINCSE